jgi:23S rRNA (adenine2503-C2)-methyltransferase
VNLINKIKSQVDNTVKYVFDVRGQPVEFSYINKNDGKDIICTPTQTNCKLGCKFCFLTGYDAPVINLTADEVNDGIKHIVVDTLMLGHTFLVSFMGSGDPLNNPHLDAVIRSIYAGCTDSFENVRFAVASIIPSKDAFFKFTTEVGLFFNIKFHLSLHSPFDVVRKDLMPAAHPVADSIRLLREYRDRTGNDVEIHYALMDGQNNRDEDCVELVRLLRNLDIPVKFLDFKEREDRDLKKALNVDDFRVRLAAAGIRSEHYFPPGADIGASCGQFLQLGRK